MKIKIKKVLNCIDKLKVLIKGKTNFIFKRKPMIKEAYISKN